MNQEAVRDRGLWFMRSRATVRPGDRSYGEAENDQILFTSELAQTQTFGEAPPGARPPSPTPGSRRLSDCGCLEAEAISRVLRCSQDHSHRVTLSVLTLSQTVAEPSLLKAY